jgi:hypothetical protein
LELFAVHLDHQEALVFAFADDVHHFSGRNRDGGLMAALTCQSDGRKVCLKAHNILFSAGPSVKPNFLENAALARR